MQNAPNVVPREDIENVLWGDEPPASDHTPIADSYYLMQTGSTADVARDKMQPIEHTRVLLVEDHRDLAETIVDFLETMGCIVDYAADGLSGLHLARTQKFDVILLDVMLPGIDGLELARKLREQHTSSCLLYTSPSPRDATLSRMPSSA